MLSRGVYLAPSQFEAAFVSLAHGEEEIERTLEAAAGALQEIANRERIGVSSERRKE